MGRVTEFCDTRLRCKLFFQVFIAQHKRLDLPNIKLLGVPTADHNLHNTSKEAYCCPCPPVRPFAKGVTTIPKQGARFVCVLLLPLK